MASPKKKETRADLKRKIIELEAQVASRVSWSSHNLAKAMDRHGSACILTITALGGEEIIKPVAIRDGLSLESVQALRNDLMRSFNLATEIRPVENK